MPSSPYQTPPKPVKLKRGLPNNQGLGGRRNPGGGGDNSNFDDNCPVPKITESQKSRTFDYEFFPYSKKKQSNEECESEESQQSELKENVQQTEVVSIID